MKCWTPKPDVAGGCAVNVYAGHGQPLSQMRTCGVRCRSKSTLCPLHYDMLTAIRVRLSRLRQKRR